MQHSAEVRRCLIDCDIAQLMKLWAHIAPHLPQPATDDDAWAALHYARTVAASLSFKDRAYSHAWLCDQGWPSGLPDHMRPRAERMYPRPFAAVGHGSMSLGGRKTDFNRAIDKVMGDAVLETFADGHRDEPDIVRSRMMEKRAEFKRKA